MSSAVSLVSIRTARSWRDPAQQKHRFFGSVEPVGSLEQPESVLRCAQRQSRSRIPSAATIDRLPAGNDRFASRKRMCPLRLNASSEKDTL
jgi:hypothetical protein